MSIQTTTPNGLATIEDSTPAHVATTADTINLLSWAQELDAAHRIASALAKTSVVPATFRGKPDECAAVILAGKALGLDPLTSLQNIFEVKGRPAMYARTMVSLVLGAGHEVKRTAATNESVTVAARRKGDPDWQEFTWDIDRARQAGYLTNKKYETDPIAMLTAKAQAEACRTVAPDVLTGVAAWSREEIELEDMGERPAAPKHQPSPALAAQVAAAENVDTTTGEIPETDWYARMEPIVEDATALRALYSEAAKAGADADVLASIAAAGTEAAKAA
ncbi:MAG: hypothetical protein ACTMIK_11270 [Galactobacter sp.]